MLILECLSPCETCYKTSVNCLTCIDNLFLDESTNTCRTCHPLCNSCIGVLSTQCLSCKYSPTIISISPRTCSCKENYYYDSDKKECQACSPLCSSCFGPSSNECYDCTKYEVEDDKYLCVSQCEDLGNYYLDGTTCKGILLNRL